EWAADGTAWNLTALVRHIIQESTAAQPRSQVWGPNWFRTADGAVLYKLAESLADVPSGARRFDWSPLHDLLARLPAGRWTTYGDLAAIIGTAAQPLGLHVASCAACSNPWRVVGADGRPRAGFALSDPSDRRSQADALMAEGVPFVNGAADPSARLTPNELNALLS
ncbi:MAG TPA: hypothetical protein VGB03_09770, partial [Acidimicrobiales bacterium]